MAGRLQATVVVLTLPLEDPGVFRGQLPQIWRRIAQKLLFPSLFWPAVWRMYPMHPAAHVMEHFPSVDSQLALDPDRQLPGSFVQDLVRDVLFVFLDDGEVLGVVPCLEVVEQLVAQEVPHARWLVTLCCPLVKRLHSS